jgi:hypothetical protein
MKTNKHKSSTLLKSCRVCGSTDLTDFLNFGELSFSGIFPSNKTEVVESGVVNLVYCMACTQVQLGFLFDADVMYGENYGYMSQLNDSMRLHLSNMASNIVKCGKRFYGMKLNEIPLRDLISFLDWARKNRPNDPDYQEFFQESKKPSHSSSCSNDRRRFF